MRQHFLSINWCLVACCAVVMGCGGAEHAAQIEKQANEIERLEVQLRDADGRLEVASKQLHAANEHAERLERSLEATKKECDELKRQAAEDVGALQRKYDAIAGELALAQKRLAELDRKGRDVAEKLSPVGVWALDGKPAYRFLFFENGTGVFHRWDAKEATWQEGEPFEQAYRAGEPALRSDGKFMFRASGASGAFEMRFVRSGVKKIMEKNGVGLVRDYEVVEKREEKPVDLMVAMKSPDTLRLVGWQSADSVLKRVDESWKPEESK